MPTNDDIVNTQRLVRWLGPDGAKAGLLKSKVLTVDDLRRECEALRVDPPKGATRQQLIDALVLAANRRIVRSADDLMRMSEAELTAYFDEVDPSREELLEFLKTLSVRATKESRRELIRFAARELSETGRFARIASSGISASAEPPALFPARTEKERFGAKRVPPGDT